MFSAATKSAHPAGGVTYIEDVFSTYLYTANGTNKVINNGIDLAGKGGLVWIKDRTATWPNVLTDSARGTGKYLISNQTTQEQNWGADALTFTSNGFNVPNNTVVPYTNYSTDNYASWSFRKQPKFFDIVTYTGDDTYDRLISHNLGSQPGFVVIKAINDTSDWNCRHIGAGTSGFKLNTTAGGENIFGPYNTDITSTTFKVSKTNVTYDSFNTNRPGVSYVAYLFASNAGGFGLTGTDNVISCGSFTSNSSGGITPVNLGYEPQWLLVKNASGGDGWRIQDVMRGWNQTQLVDLSPNDSGGDRTINNNPSYFSPTATGFSTPTPGIFTPSQTFIYMAIRRPMKVPTDATTVFKPVARAGTSDVASITGLGFAPDSMLTKNRGSGGSVDWSFNFFDRLRSGGKGYRLSTAYSNAEDTSINFLTEMGSDGVSFPSIGYTATNGDGYNYINYMFARRPGFFDEVCYTTPGSTFPAIAHNLGVVPELIIVKQRNSSNDWGAQYVPAGSNSALYLNATDGFGAGGWSYYFNTVTSTSITAATSVSGYSAGTYIAYLFATCAGVSKVGSYTGNGSTQAISCGFTGGARFVLIKRTDSTGDWYTYDTARGMTTVTDPYLLINSTAGQVATLGSVTTTAGGFTVDATILAAINTNAASYIFLAIA